MNQFGAFYEGTHSNSGGMHIAPTVATPVVAQPPRGVFDEVPFGDQWYVFRVRAGLSTLVAGLVLGIVWQWGAGFLVAGMSALSVLDSRAVHHRLCRSLAIDTTLMGIAVIAVGIPSPFSLLPFAYTIASAALLLTPRQLLGVGSLSVGWAIVVGFAPAMGFEPQHGTRAVIVSVISTVIFTAFLIGLHTEANRSIGRWMGIQRALAESSQDLLEARDEAAIDRTLVRLLGATDADYAYIDRNYMHPQKGLSAFIIHAAERPTQEIFEGDDPWWEGAYSEMPSWYEHLSRGEPFVAVTRDLPEPERARCVADGLKSELNIPIHVNGEWVGSIAFADYLIERNWSAQEMMGLRAAADMIGSVWERKEADAHRRQSAARTAALLSAIPDVILQVDRGGVCISAHHGTRPLAGVACTARPGAPIGEAFDPETRRLVHEAIHDALATDDLQTVEFNPVPERPDTAFEARLVPIHESDQVMIMIRDVSDRRAAQRALEDALRSKNQFLASVSHELRTPLTAVLGYAEVLVDIETIEAGEAQAMAGTIVEQAADMRNIVEDLLVAARAELGELQVVHHRVDLAEEIEAVTAAMGADIPLVIEGPAAVIGDGPRIRQVVRNLLSNALRYGGGRVEVRLRSDGLTTSVEVRDDGVGISPSRQEAVFEPYQRDHTRPGVPGSIGLGLTISRQLARLMDGEVSYARRGGWTTFTLTLPSAAPVAA